VRLVRRKEVLSSVRKCSVQEVARAVNVRPSRECVSWDHLHLRVNRIHLLVVKTDPRWNVLSRDRSNR
jgi:hypothetical protein